MLTEHDINELTSEFNSLQSYPYSDYLVTKMFAKEIDTFTHYERVALLDALFDTKLRQSRPVGGRERKSIFQISEAIRISLDQLNQVVGNLHQDNLFTLDLTDEHIKGLIKTSLQYLLNCLNNNSLSFTGKYLHFVFPKIFPLWDRLVPQAINDVFDDELFPENTPNTSDYYLLLCQKYQEIASNFSEVQIGQMVNQDYESQPVGWKVRNTFVRILDKSLWIYQKSRTE